VLPIKRPGKVICVGLNYRGHAEEQGVKLPEHPLLFAKWPTALTGPGDPIVLPSSSTQVDYEAELGVVIGSRVKGVRAENALEAVRGYLCANDVTARDLQRADGQFTRSKSLDTFGPLGEFVSAAEVGDPQQLRIRCLVNGEVRQSSSTADMIFSVAEVIEFVSAAITLEPGDLLLTGTPAGVGVFRDPPIFLAEGDEVTVEIERLETLTNPVRG
jgi:2-keto-4-pentenoate hydratase/2-oxohepta-3-ene-1,7-dioic acid hydratase in catechol pathway